MNVRILLVAALAVLYPLVHMAWHPEQGPFRQANAFYVVCSIALVIVAVALHRARIGGLKTRERELEALADERRIALEALDQSETDFRALFHNVLEGVYRSTLNGRIILVNPAMVEILGYESAEALLAVPASTLYADPGARDALVQHLQEYGEARGVEITMLRADGQPVTTVVNARARRDDRGKVAYVDGTMLDITSRKQLEEQVQQLQKIESVGRLAGGIAHDFNNLLTPILGYTEMLLDDTPEGDQRRGPIEEIQKAATSASSLTRQLLAFSRRQVLAPRVIDVNQVVANLENMLRRLVGDNVDMQFRLSDVPYRVKADPGQLEQVVLNLVVNARDAMPGGGAITISTLQQKACGEVGLFVRDTGSGMTPDVRERIFEPFYTTKRHGTGLGLSTVYSIVAQSGGRIDLETTPGAGSSFSIWLPAVTSCAENETRPATSYTVTAGETVLVVEDNEAVRRLAQTILERSGFRVILADRGDEAERLAAAAGHAIDLLLTDVVMPGINGVALAERLRSRRPSLRVLFTTGYIDEDVAREGVTLDYRRVLQKPFTPDALIRAVRQTLDEAA